MRSLIGSLLGVGITNLSPVPLSTKHRERPPLSIQPSLQPALMGTQGSVGTIFAIVNRVSTAVAKADWHLYKRAASGVKDDRTPVTSHPSIDLWKKPNPRMSERRFIEMTQQHVELVGENALIATVASLGKTRVPIELWPTRPDRIQVVPDPYEFIKGYVYTDPDGGKMPLETDELYRVIMPNALDPYRGLGPVQSILTDADNVKYSSEWNRSFFMNSAEPGGVIQVPTALNDDEFDRMRDQWSATHQGVSKAHRVAILESDATWVSNSFTHRDMQFAELRTLGRDVILEAWGMPKSMLGIVEDVNRANAEASEYVFAKWMIEERLDRWKDLRNEMLTAYGPAGEGLEWDYDSPVPENSDQENASIVAKSGALATLTEKGFDAAELLKFFGWPEISYSKPEPPTIVAPGGAPGQEKGGSDKPPPKKDDQ
jgi:HK97 family phage portal protein